ncbi:MAG: response regulator [Clostridium sp.]|jgi:two-component system response regulator YesN|nr:response regulator [Clostridium sp.]
MLSVLLVDDERVSALGLSVLIDWEAQGYEIAGIMANGKEALEFLSRHKVDLIISDIRMPVMSGIELLQAMRRKNISDAYFIILSSYSDFEYARQVLRYDCMDYLLKPIKEKDLTEILRKVADMHQADEERKQENRQVEQAYLARNVIVLLSGKYDQINLEYVKSHMRLSEGVRYANLEVDATKEAQAVPEEGKRELQRRLYRNCVDELGKESGHCIFDASGQKCSYDVGLIYCDYMAREKGMGEEEYFRKFLESISVTLELPVVMFVGSRVADIGELAESYRTASVIRAFSAFHTAGGVIYYEKEVRKRNAGTVLCKKSVDELISAIERSSGEEIDRKTDSLYEEMKNLRVNTALMDLNINYLLFQLIHLATEQDSNVNQEDIMRSSISNVLNWGALRGNKENLKRFARSYGEYLVQLRKNASWGVLSQVEKDIREHYGQNLTLKEFSRKYYVNGAYLGQIFQKKYGVAFKEYLNNYRMEQAVKMLLYTDKKIYEIAEEVGYRDLDYFTNRFILANGCTPSKFRKRSKA